MPSFWGHVVGLAAGILGMFGAMGLALVPLYLALHVHWAFGACALLIPVWLAAAMQIMEWASDQ